LFEQRKQRHVHASSSQSVVVFVVDVFFFFVLFPFFPSWILAALGLSQKEQEQEQH
jgi:hypothetical protein